jgi:hypothetical protein
VRGLPRLSLPRRISRATTTPWPAAAGESKVGGAPCHFASWHPCTPLPPRMGSAGEVGNADMHAIKYQLQLLCSVHSSICPPRARPRAAPHRAPRSLFFPVGAREGFQVQCCHFLGLRLPSYGSSTTGVILCLAISPRLLWQIWVRDCLSSSSSIMGAGRIANPSIFMRLFSHSIDITLSTAYLV